ncbi:MAG: carboxypeptidase-like regulatory domain-containing protein [Saprospiraceae bacterium]|nr:carboxypeptidase-like regulatory domain-containing protein [Saprospiraceae bacterium]
MQQPHNSNLSHYAKRSKSLAITMVLIFTSAFHLLAQNTVIKGQVLDDKNRLALEGVSIQVTNSKIGTTTNTLGEFSLLSNDAFPQTLEISYTGFEKNLSLYSQMNS